MKKILIFALALFLVSATLHAQKKYSFGFEVAPHISWASSNTNNVEQDGTSFGIKYGLRGDSFFGDNYAITSGLMISHTSIDLLYNEGLTLKTIDSTYDIADGNKVSYHFQYLEVPLGLKFQSNEIGYVRILFEGGFIPALQLRSSATADIVDVQKEELKEGTSLLALSYYFEGGITYSLGAQVAIKGTAYYSSGILDRTTGDDDSEDRITQNTVGLKIGLVF